MPELAPLKYKTYTWPHNPQTYRILFEKDTAVYSYPYSNTSEIDDLGKKPREVNGTGEFIGEGAYEEFKKLASIFYDKGPGSLIHPIWQIQRAIFTKLEVEQEPTPDYVKYSFSFIEGPPEDVVKNIGKKITSNPTTKKKSTSTSGKSHTVKKGDTMWAIAKRNKISLKDLVKKNPQIKNPNLIYPGNKINL